MQGRRSLLVQAHPRRGEAGEPFRPISQRGSADASSRHLHSRSRPRRRLSHRAPRHLLTADEGRTNPGLQRDQELGAVWNIAQHLWVRDYPVRTRRAASRAAFLPRGSDMSQGDRSKPFASARPTFTGDSEGAPRAVDRGGGARRRVYRSEPDAPPRLASASGVGRQAAFG